MWAVGVYSLGLTEDQIWDLSLGQYYKLIDKLEIDTYNTRYDIGAFHASFIRANFKNSSQFTTRQIIGERPIASDEIEEKVSGNEMLKAFRSMMPARKLASLGV